FERSKSEALRTFDQVAARCPGTCGCLAIAIVFADEDGRKLPDSCKVEGFKRCTLVHGTIAGEHDGHAVVAQNLRGKRCTADERSASADDAVCAQHALGEIRNMHGATTALA